MKRIAFGLAIVIWLVGCGEKSSSNEGRSAPDPERAAAANEITAETEHELERESADDKVAPPHAPDAPFDEPPGDSPEQAEDQTPRVLTPFPHIAVNLTERIVEIDGFAAIDVGWLEQVMCTPGTREHESLVVTSARPSEIHAALLLAQFEPGSPGAWSWDDENERVRLHSPKGERIDVFVRYENSEGEQIEEPVRTWIRDHLGRHDFPGDSWVFCGSRLAENPPESGGGEYYIADYSGSVIGLVTFGDEVIGWSKVLSDQEAVQPPEWEVNTDHVPPPGTEVTVILKPTEDQKTSAPGETSVVEAGDEENPP